MTELEKLYKKVKSSDFLKSGKDWMKHVTLAELCEGTNIITDDMIRRLRLDYHTYCQGVLEDYLTSNMNDKKILAGIRVKHKETGEKYIVYRVCMKDLDDISDGDCYTYTMTTGDTFSSKDIIRLSAEETMSDIKEELSCLKVGDIITWDRVTAKSTAILVLNISDDTINAVMINSPLNTPLLSIPKSSYDVHIISHSIPQAIPHRLLVSNFEYNDGYCCEVGVANHKNREMLKKYRDLVAIDVCNSLCHATRSIRRANILTIPKNHIVDFLTTYYSDDGNSLSIRKMNVFVKNINSRVIYEYLTSENEREIEDIYKELEDNE